MEVNSKSKKNKEPKKNTLATSFVDLIENLDECKWVNFPNTAKTEILSIFNKKTTEKNVYTDNVLFEKVSQH